MPATDHRPALPSSYANAAEIVSGVRPDQLALASCCADYDVDNLVSHLVGAGWRTAALGRGEAPTAGSFEFPHVELADGPEELRRAAKDAEAAWADDDRLSMTLTMPWGETYTGETLVNMYVAELAAHAWDLAAATGQRDRLQPLVAGPALDAARAFLRPEYRDLLGPGNPYGPEVEAPEDATQWERFAAFMGRSPRP